MVDQAKANLVTKSFHPSVAALSPFVELNVKTHCGPYQSKSSPTSALDELQPVWTASFPPNYRSARHCTSRELKRIKRVAQSPDPTGARGGASACLRL